MIRLTCSVTALLALGLMAAAPAGAQTLEEALATSYASNPTLQAARAQLRATDELVPQALSNWRPTVQADGSVGPTWEDVRGRGSGAFPLGTAGLSVTQPLYRGGSSSAQLSQAENLVRAGRAQLAGVEQQVLLDSVTAYVDVLAAQALLDLNKNNEQVLAEQLRATRERFDVGEVTKTDVSQAEARLAGATAGRIQAEGNLTSFRAVYRKQFGEMPGNLQVPKSLPSNLPANEAETVAQSESNPNLVTAVYAERAAEDGTDVVFGALLPTVSLDGEVLAQQDLSGNKFGNSDQNSAQLLARITIPLYQAGSVESQVRESKQTAAQSRRQVDEQRRLAEQQATTAWRALETAQAQITSFRAQVASTKTALEGVEQEQSVGLRTVLDVLDAQQEVLNAETSLVQARRDEVVAAYTVLFAVGRLTAADLKLPTERYNVDQHYNEVRGKWWGLNASGQ
jgi:TolC family type I secretion outer membrane protein